jgi:hypothetical protein
MFFILYWYQFFGRAGRKSRRAIHYKSSQSFAFATLCCGLFATIPHANAINQRLICKYSLLDLTTLKKLSNLLQIDTFAKKFPIDKNRQHTIT